MPISIFMFHRVLVRTQPVSMGMTQQQQQQYEHHSTGGATNKYGGKPHTM